MLDCLNSFIEFKTRVSSLDLLVLFIKHILGIILSFVQSSDFKDLFTS